jgi:biotin carboxyl carrier protein
LGTFYRSPKPGTPPFVEVGSIISAETEICLIEVMKLFTTVRAGVRGTVREVYPADSDLVEYNQPLFLVEP